MTNEIKMKLCIIGLLCLCFPAWTQEPVKKPLKDWDISEAKKKEHVKIIKHLKFQEEIFKEDSICGVAPAKDDDDEKQIRYYQEINKRIAERERLQKVDLMTYRPPVEEWNEPLIADSITGIIGPQILESYWMNQYGDRITKVAPDAVAYLVVRTQCYEANDTLTVTLQKSDGSGYSNGKKEIVTYIFADEDGIAIWANNIWK